MGTYKDFNKDFRSKPKNAHFGFATTNEGKKEIIQELIQNYDAPLLGEFCFQICGSPNINNMSLKQLKELRDELK